MNDDQLSAIYKKANGEDIGKAKPLTTQNIFRAMRAVLASTPSPLQVVPDTKALEWGRQIIRFLLKTSVPVGPHAAFEAALDALAAPQVAQPAVRVPLTEAERTELIEDHGLHEGPASWRDVEVFLEATEQACAKKWGVPLSSEKGNGQ